MDNYVSFLNQELKEKYGLSLLDSKGEYRNIDEVVDELSKLFISLPDDEQDNLCKLFLGD